MAKENSVREKLHQTALKAPASSGVYLWRDAKGTVIYVGKAKVLKNRLSSYFSGQKDIKTRILVSHADSIEYITTSNEYEAFLLENNLIKQYKPRYNIDLKDGKSYPVLRLTNEAFPRLFKTRQVLHDGSAYFGPFPDAGALDTFIDTIYRLYPLRHCRRLNPKRGAPCMYYHIGSCRAPCCGKIQKEEYAGYIEEIQELLEGGTQAAEKIKLRMHEAAKQLNFEKAARLRDGLSALAIMRHQNVVEDFDMDDRDYVAFYADGELASFTVLRMRGGKLLGRDNYRATSLNDEDDLLPEFLAAYYTEPELVPPVIYVSSMKDMDFFQKWLGETLRAECRVILVQGGMADEARHSAALAMAFQNAKEDIIRRKRERGDVPAMTELADLLGTKNLPVRIEGFDIAHIDGKFPVASLISFRNGNPDKKNYRYFRLRTTDGIIDDFASMREAATRRYTRLLNEHSEMPDLILIDGGIGQVNAVKGVLDALGLNIPIIGLAKRDEEIYLPGNSTPVSLPKRSDALRLLQRVRDETHRFATSRNQALRTKENVVSLFSALPHVGEKRARTLAKRFVTMERLAGADSGAVSALLKVPEEAAKDIIAAAKTSAQELRAAQERKKAAFGTQGIGRSETARLAELALSAAGNPPPEHTADS